MSCENNPAPQTKKRKYTPWSFKQRLPLALLAAFAFPFTIIIYGVFDIYAGNRAEFDFALTDVWSELLLICAACFVVLAAILLLLRKRAFDIAFAVIFWITIMAYFQGTFLNFGMNALAADGTGIVVENIGLMILNSIIWLVVGVGCILAVTMVKSRDLVQLGAIILLVMVIAMQLMNFTITSLTTDVFKPKSEQTDLVDEDTDSDTEEGESEDNTTSGDKESSGESSTSAPSDSEVVTSSSNGSSSSEESTLPPNIGEVDLKNLVLTEENLYTVSSKNNIIIFMVDRFDANYAQRMWNEDESFFDGLTGFTYYSDNISLYPRTYPAVASMITGITNDFSGTASEYFENAYQNSEFLKLLKNEDYSINIYGDNMYVYRDAKELYGVADNLSLSNGYKIVNKGGLITNLIGLSTYRYVPLAAKQFYTLSSTSFKGYVQYDAVYPKFETNDAEFYSGLLADGLTVREDDKNTYSFICLNGCHSPYNLTADGKYSEEETSLEEATRGTFKIIYEYLDQLRELGLYEDSTIIITGDHANAVSDTKYLDGKRQTAIFFKQSGKNNEPLAYSASQVSQDNMIPSIVESEGIETEINFGECYWDIPEGEDRERRYFLIRSLRDKDDNRADELVEYKIVGDGGDFENWEIVNETLIGYLYK